MFCINIDIDKMLLIDKNKDLGFNLFSYFPLKFLKRYFGFCLLLNNFNCTIH